MLTPEQVKERATTPEKALDVSIQHWEELCGLNESKTRSAYDSSRQQLLRGQYCGLCQHKKTTHADGDCSPCLLNQKVGHCEESDSQWLQTSLALGEWRDKSASFAKYKTEAKAMLALLKKLKQENYGKDKTMNKNDEIKAQIKQVNTDIAALRDERAKLEQERDKEGAFEIASQGGTIFEISHCNSYINMFLSHSSNIISWYPETARELAKELIRVADKMNGNSEDLEEFNVLGHGCPSDGLTARVDNKSIRIILKGNGRITTDLWFDLDGATEIHQKLGQMLATIRRQNANKS